MAAAASGSASSSIAYHCYMADASSVIDRLRGKEGFEPLEIPEHQRDFVWPESKQILLIQTILANRPMASILIRRHSSGRCSLEDGQQRLTTIRHFLDGRFSVNGLKFSDLPPITQVRIQMYRVVITEYSNATDKEAIEIFDNFQNGMPLSVGERLHSMASLSPLIRAIRQILLTPGEGLYARATAVWGLRSLRSGSRCSDLARLFAICAGLVFGPDAISKKWTDVKSFVSEEMTLPMSADTDETRKAFLERMLERLIQIYEAAQAILPASSPKLKKQLDPGYLSGYIAYSLVKYPDEFERLKTRWVEFITSARADKTVLENVLYKDLSKARSWTACRWKMGYLRVFDPAAAEAEAATLDGLSDSVSVHEEEEDDE